jgi:hypothetical protein
MTISELVEAVENKTFNDLIIRMYRNSGKFINNENIYEIISLKKILEYNNFEVYIDKMDFNNSIKDKGKLIAKYGSCKIEIDWEIDSLGKNISAFVDVNSTVIIGDSKKAMKFKKKVKEYKTWV